MDGNCPYCNEYFMFNWSAVGKAISCPNCNKSIYLYTDDAEDDFLVVEVIPNEDYE